MEVLSLGFKRKKKIFLIGLDGSGKATLIESLKNDQIYEKLLKEKVTITSSDLGGHHMPYHCYEVFNEKYDSIIFIVDASDSDRFEEAKIELQLALSKWKKIPFLILCNKYDLETAASKDQLISELELTNLIHNDDIKDLYKEQPIQLFMCSGKNKTGYYEGFKWLVKYLNINLNI